MNNFVKYSSREEYIIKKWISNNKWLSDIVVSYEADNTSYHDYKLLLKNGKQVIVEIKEEEYFWYEKTGNIGLDFLSAFNFKNDLIKKRYMYNYLWVKKGTIDNFLNKDIVVHKYGKLFTCDSHIQLFYCEDKGGNPILIKTYNNKKLKEKIFIEYLKENYNLRINDKKAYELNDDWESAAFFIKPSDERLKECEINSYSEFSEI